MKVSIIVTAFLEENKRYLDLCMRSIQNLDYPKKDLDVIVVGRECFKPEYPNTTLVVTKDERYTAEGINAGINAMHKDSKYVLYLNDDAFVTRDTLKTLIAAMEGDKVILNALSPCDSGWRYKLMFPIQYNGELLYIQDRFYEYEQLEKYFDAMINAHSVYPPGHLYQDYLCMYATFFSRQAIDEIGLFDENFKSGQCDLDYSIRASQKGYRLGSSFNSLIWHFGGATSSKVMDSPRRLANIKYFKQKWGSWPPGIAQETIENLEKGQDDCKKLD